MQELHAVAFRRVRKTVTQQRDRQAETGADPSRAPHRQEQRGPAGRAADQARSSTLDVERRARGGEVVELPAKAGADLDPRRVREGAKKKAELHRREFGNAPAALDVRGK